MRRTCSDSCWSCRSGPGEPAVGADFRRLATGHTYAGAARAFDSYQVALAVFAERAAGPAAGA